MNDRKIDQMLVERAQQGEQKAFEMLMSKYQRRLFRLITRFVKDEHDVNDVAQEAMIKAYRALPGFRGESAFYTWLYRIAINTAKNFLITSGSGRLLVQKPPTKKGMFSICPIRWRITIRRKPKWSIGKYCKLLKQLFPSCQTTYGKPSP